MGLCIHFSHALVTNGSPKGAWRPCSIRAHAPLCRPRSATLRYRDGGRGGGYGVCRLRHSHETKVRKGDGAADGNKGPGLHTCAGVHGVGGKGGTRE